MRYTVFTLYIYKYVEYILSFPYSTITINNNIYLYNVTHVRGLVSEIYGKYTDGASVCPVRVPGDPGYGIQGRAGQGRGGFERSGLVVQ